MITIFGISLDWIENDKHLVISEISEEKQKKKKGKGKKEKGNISKLCSAIEHNEMRLLLFGFSF